MRKVAFTVLMVAAAVLPVSFLLPVLAPSPASEARVYFFDVGQGDAALIDAGNGTQVLIDGGPDRSVLHGLGKAMPAFDRRIELVVLSHPHLDHYGGLIDVVSRYDVGAVLVNQAGDGRPYDRLVETVRSESRMVPAAGQRIPLPGGRLEVLEPAAPGPGGPERKQYANPNDASIVVRVELHGRTFLFPGDAERAEERRLLGDRGLDADVLKVPHHGSRTSSTEEFLAEVTPRWCVISSGEGNSYGHPNPGTVARLAAHGCRTVRTDRHGTVIAVTGENGVRFVSER